MTDDKEIGELWRRFSNDGAPNTICDLIRKLVEERRDYYILERILRVAECEQDALRDFGIDPKEWK